MAEALQNTRVPPVKAATMCLELHTGVQNPDYCTGQCVQVNQYTREDIILVVGDAQGLCTSATTSLSPLDPIV